MQLFDRFENGFFLFLDIGNKGIGAFFDDAQRNRADRAEGGLQNDRGEIDVLGTHGDAEHFCGFFIADVAVFQIRLGKGRNDIDVGQIRHHIENQTDIRIGRSMHLRDANGTGKARVGHRAVVLLRFVVFRHGQNAVIGLKIKIVGEVDGIVHHKEGIAGTELRVPGAPDILQTGDNIDGQHPLEVGEEAIDLFESYELNTAPPVIDTELQLSVVSQGVALRHVENAWGYAISVDSSTGELNLK